MAMIDALLAELEQESQTTARVLERVPQDHLSWKPHPKSMSLGQLALHIATVPGNVAELASMDTIPSHRALSSLRRQRPPSSCRRSTRASQRHDSISAASTMRGAVGVWTDGRRESLRRCGCRCDALGGKSGDQEKSFS